MNRLKQYGAVVGLTGAVYLLSGCDMYDEQPYRDAQTATDMAAEQLRVPDTCLDLVRQLNGLQDDGDTVVPETACSTTEAASITNLAAFISDEKEAKDHFHDMHDWINPRNIILGSLAGLAIGGVIRSWMD